MNSRHRSVGLDVLRAVAVLMVLICHSVPCPASTSAWGHSVCLWLKQGGWTGVDLFFVLSGFLVGGLLFKEQRDTGTIKIGRFFLRRGFKIYPPFWIFLVFIISWELRQGLPVGFEDVLPELFFFQNYLPGVWGTNWSLGVEEHFYLLLPLALMLLAVSSRDAAQPFHRLPWVVGCIVLACLALRAWNARSQFSNYSHLTPTHLRIDGLFFGALLAYFHVYEHARFVTCCRRFRWPLLAAGIAAFLPAYFLPMATSRYMQVAGLMVQWLGAGALICSTLARTSAPGRMARALAAVGRTSYATYLWHYWIGLFGLMLLPKLLGFKWNWLGFTFCYYAATLGAGFLLTALIERPFLRLRDRLVPTAPRAPHRPAPLVLVGALATTE
jgi:peptidoglycan/LPS O-acetylase OafA/YrhL